eukprot:gene10170-2590_t
MKFCVECNNMLYPAEDRENRKLIYVCRRCEEVREKNPSNLINKNTLTKTEEDQFKSLKLSELVSDPTLPRTNYKCPKCKEEGSVLLQERSTNAMSIWHICISCSNKWKQKNL